jgi:Ca-activated chloride channel family protein
MTQARAALKYCLSNLQERDRFALMNFATTVNKYTDRLLPANTAEIERARKWVDDLEATGGTAIDDALTAALAMRSSDDTRNSTVVFFTDGQPTIGETEPEKILKNVAAKNTASTRIFTFGVGEDVNASMLDRLAEQTRAISTYVREAEDIEAKVSGLYGKISNPVLTNLKLTVGPNVKLAEVYPPQLPDLFHGTQLVVLGRYTGKGHVAVKLTGNVGKEVKEFVYETTFPEKTGEDKNFVEDLWARRKVGYMLDQIRVNGEKKELVDEVVALAKRYGISTPYTSYLIVPDAPVTAVRRPGRDGFAPAPFLPPGLAAPRAGGPQAKVADFAKELKGDLGGARGKIEDDRLNKAPAPVNGETPQAQAAASDKLKEEKNTKKALEQARYFLNRRQLEDVQAGQLGVDLSLQTNNLRNQTRLSQTAVRRVQNRNCLEVGGVWIDEGFDPKMKTVTVKAQSAAYFRILERHAKVRQVYQLGNHIVWVTPSNMALVVDASNGVTTLSDAAIDELFVRPKKK